MQDKYIEFAIKEYESLKKENADSILESRIIERHAILASGVIWAWILTQPMAVNYIYILKILPLCICMLGAIRSFALHIRLIRISAYLRHQELFYGNEQFFSWENVLSRKSWVLTGTSIFFWIILILANLAATKMLG